MGVRALVTAPLLGLALGLAPAQAAEVSDAAFDQAITTIDRLYLRPDEVTPAGLLEGAAAGIVNDVPWLFATATEDGAIVLRHADGTELGRAQAATLAEVPAALRAMTAAITGSGYPVDPDVDVRLELLEGITRGLDKYSKVLAGASLDSFDTRLKGTLVGIGATLTLRQDRVTVKALTPGGPAEAGGLQIGDVIARIDGASTVNMPIKEAVRRIRGEEGTPVVLEVERAQTPLELSLARAEVVLPNVTSESLGDGVGYLRIDHFSQHTTENLAAELADLRAHGALDRGLVLDLRGNTGGSMKESARAADAFLTAGMLLRTAGRDGGRVQNLQARMDASDDGHEPPIPLVLLVDDRTASGSEILAGALVQLDRAVVIGTPTYGKGKVQKIYRLDEEARLKLTVAEYLLAGDRQIDGAGIVPDLVVGEVYTDAYGVRFRGWDALTQAVPWDDVVPVLRARRDGEDVARDIAKAVALAAERADRQAGLGALAALVGDLRAEREAAIVDALTTEGLDWRAADAPGDAPDARVTLDSALDPDRPDVVIVHATVHNDGPAPLARARVDLTCDTLSVWDDLVVPVGYVPARTAVTGTLAVPLRPGVGAREDLVDATLFADQRPPLELGEHVLESGSSARPQLEVEVQLTGDGVDRIARVTLHSLDALPLTGVEIYFGHPGDVGVELVDHAARVPRVEPGASVPVDLAMLVKPDAPAQIPLPLVIEADRYDTLARWTLDVPRDGAAVTARPPVVTAPRLPASAATGSRDLRFQVRDDGAVQHVVVWLNGEKAAYAGPSKGGVDLRVPAELRPGANLFTVVATDDQDLETRETFVVRGEAPAAADATD